MDQRLVEAPPRINSSHGRRCELGRLLVQCAEQRFILTNYISRIDYNINDKMKLYGRFTIARENAVLNPNEFAGDPASRILRSIACMRL